MRDRFRGKLPRVAAATPAILAGSLTAWAMPLIFAAIVIPAGGATWSVNLAAYVLAFVAMAGAWAAHCS